MISGIGPNNRQVLSRTTGGFSSSPLLVFYEVTRACDLVCQHCRACAQPASDPAELNSEASLRLIEQLTEFPKPPMLVLTGGDPLKRADIFELVEHGTSLGLEVSITPSATPLVTSAAIRRLAAAGIARLALSIDGPDAASHDVVRGVAGSFCRTLRILADAGSEGIPLQVNTTITSANVDQIDRMAELLAELNIVMWSVFFLVPVGRASSSARLSAEQCESAFDRLWRQATRQPFAIKTTEAPHYRRFVMQQGKQRSRNAASQFPVRHKPKAINDGKGIMFVSHTGLVHPSGFLPIVCGVYPLEGVVRIYQQSPIFRGLRDPARLEGKCRVCEYRNVCGGSRARAYAVTGNPFAEEPDCAYTPQTISM